LPNFKYKFYLINEKQEKEDLNDFVLESYGKQNTKDVSVYAEFFSVFQDFYNNEDCSNRKVKSEVNKSNYEKNLKGLSKNLLDFIEKEGRIDVEEIFNNYTNLKNSEEFINLKKFTEMVNTKLENNEKEIKIISSICSNIEEKAYSSFEAENIKLKNKIEELEKYSLKNNIQLIEDIKLLNDRSFTDKLIIDNLQNEVKQLKENTYINHDKKRSFNEISMDIKDLIKNFKEYVNFPIEN